MHLQDELAPLKQAISIVANATVYLRMNYATPRSLHYFCS